MCDRVRMMGKKDKRGKKVDLWMDSDEMQMIGQKDEERVEKRIQEKKI